MALDRLIEAIKRTQTPTVAGLDPKLEYIPSHIKEAAWKGPPPLFWRITRD